MWFIGSCVRRGLASVNIIDITRMITSYNFIRLDHIQVSLLLVSSNSRTDISNVPGCAIFDITFELL